MSVPLAVARPSPQRARLPLLRFLLGLSPDAARVARRGFRCDDEDVRARLEAVGTAFLEGYHAALERPAGGAAALGARLDALPRELVGFAYEGAAMGLALAARLLPWRRGDWEAFMLGPGARHVYMVHVGAGWALAVWPLGRARALDRLDPLLRWLALDGFGFYHGYFGVRRYVDAAQPPRLARGYVRRAFDQGLGRALWFAEGAHVERVTARIARFDVRRRADLWSGVGLACAYAGGASDDALETLASRGAAYAGELAQGAAFAAEARRLAGNLVPHTERACHVLCGTSAAAAAEVARGALAGLPGVRAGDGSHAYEEWRRRIRAYFIGSARGD